MPDINDIHRFFESNLPEYQRRHNLEIIRFFVKEAGLGDKKPIKTFLDNFKYLKEFVVYEWIGASEIRGEPLPKVKPESRQQKKKHKRMLHHDKLTDESPMPYGKHQGTKMGNLSPKYLLWLWDNDRCSESVKAYIKENKAFLELEVKQNKKNQSR